jgi:Tfp pilus assembly ATPase PilU
MPTRPSIPFLLDLLRLAMRREATAMYIVPWMPPTLRIDDRSVPLSSVSFTPEQSTLLVLDVLDDERRAALDRSREVEFGFTLDGVGRFRVHAFRRHGQPAMAIRPFALDVPTPRTLALPALACQAALADRGLLVLASRSPTLRRDAAVALLEHRNRNGEGELALLVDATRFWQEPARCQVHQGLSMAALDRLLLRRAQAPAPALSAPPPLAIAWGELRDGPQLERVMRIAERALCLVTLPAEHLLGALQRLVSLAAQHTGHALLHRTAIHLHGVLAMRPVPAIGGGHELAATVALMNSPELAASLAEGDLDALRALLAGAQAAAPGLARVTGADEHLGQLLAQGLITPEVALRHAVDEPALLRRIAAAELHPRPDALTAPVTVDTGFADVFDTGSPPGDPFDFADPSPPAAADTQFDSVDWVAGAPASRPLPLNPLPLAARAPSPHSLQFHAWTAPAVAAGQVAVIDIWAARADQAHDIARLAASGDEPPSEAAVIETDGAPLTLQLRIDGVLPAPTALRQHWTGRPQRVRFQVPVPRTTAAGAHAVRLRLGVGGLPIGELSFVLQVRPDAAVWAPPEDAHAVRRMLPSAYASFVNEDRDTVLHCIEQLQRLAPDLDVFVGAPQLRSTEGWRQRIEQETGRRERLFLFWSQAAAESPWVDFEWRHVLRRRGPGAIDTVLLQPPRLAPLPPELADLSVTMLEPRPPSGPLVDTAPGASANKTH